MPRRISLSLATSAWLSCVAVPVHAQKCERADFEAAVSTASMTLREMTNRNTPDFQDKLRSLKEKRGWSTEEFVKAAAPLVADERITEFDQKSAEYLMKINNLGGEGASTSVPDCRLLDALRNNMAELVDTQTKKWAYMFGKLEAEMAK
jgi:hypothetical protein